LIHKINKMHNQQQHIHEKTAEKQKDIHEKREEEVQHIVEHIVDHIIKHVVEHVDMELNIRTVVLSGGAVRGISILGGLQCLHDRDLLKGADTFIGTSIGAVISYLYILGFSPVELMVKLCRKGFLEELLDIDISAMFRGHQAISNFHKLQELLENLTVEKRGRFMTLHQLQDMTGKRLICSTYNLSLRKMEYMGPESHPDLPCITALRMSCSLPLLFPGFHYMGSVYVDGAMADDFPLSQIETERGTAIGIRVVDEEDHKSPVPSTSNLLDYMNCLFSVFLNNIHRLSLKMYRNRCKIIFSLLIPQEVSRYRLHLSTQDKFNMFSSGYNGVRTQLLSPPIEDDGC